MNMVYLNNYWIYLDSYPSLVVREISNSEDHKKQGGMKSGQYST